MPYDVFKLAKYVAISDLREQKSLGEKSFSELEKQECRNETYGRKSSYACK